MTSLVSELERRFYNGGEIHWDKSRRYFFVKKDGRISCKVSRGHLRDIAVRFLGRSFNQIDDPITDKRGRVIQLNSR